MVEEAKKRDHRKIGAEMHLFAMDTEYVGPGLPLWLPKGTAILEELEKLAKETEFIAGYVRVKTPHIAKEKMYLTSGHLPLLYKDSMFPPMDMSFDPEVKKRIEEIEQEEKKLSGPVNVSSILKPTADALSEREEDSDEEDDRENHLLELDQEKTRLLGENRYYLKAMNCPHHHRIFAAEPRSYRDLPLRLAEYGCCYRYEQSGELFGLMRVRSLNMNDAHIYCTPEQFAQ